MLTDAQLVAVLCAPLLAVIPLLVGPLQVLLALVPAVAVSGGGLFLALFKPATLKVLLQLAWRMKWSLIAVGSLGWTLVATARMMWPEPKRPVTALPKAETEWLALSGDARRTGVVPGSAEPRRGGINWAFRHEGASFLSTPAIVGNRLYLTAAGSGVFFNRGIIYCVDADTGAMLWKNAPPNYRAVFSSPAISGKYLVCGEGFHQTKDGRIVCLDVTRQGALLWQYHTRNHVESSPCIDKGRVYIGAGDDGYYCFELEPDAQGEPRMVWHAPGNVFIDAETSPVVVDGKMFAGLGVWGRAFVCLDADTGKELWRVPAPYPVFSPPAVVNGKVIIGMGNGNYTQSAEEAAEHEVEKLKRRGKTRAELAQAWRELQAGGAVWCVDIATQNVDWRFKLADVIMGSAAVDTNRVYFGARDGFAYCLSLDGKELARWFAGVPIMTCPALTGRLVYFVTLDGRLVALDRESFEPVWEVPLGREGWYFSSPIVARGRVYVGTPGDGLLSIGAPLGGADGLVWAGALGGPGKAGTIDGSGLSEFGAVQWVFPTNKTLGVTALHEITAPAAAVDDFLFVPSADRARPGLLCFGNERKRREAPTPKWFAPASHPIHLSPAANGTNAFFVDGQVGDADRALHCVENPTGRERWQLPVASSASGQFVLSGDSILIQATSNGLTRLDLSGKAQWNVPLGTLRDTPAWRDAIVVAALQSPSGLAALDRDTGAVLWQIPLAPTTGPVIDQNVVLVGTSTGVAARSLLDGQPVWETAHGAPTHPLSFAAGRIAYVNEAGELVVFETRTPSVVLARVKASPGVAPIIARDAVLYATNEGLMRYEFAKRRARPWLMLPGMRRTSPMILADASVYFATDEHGWMRAGRPW